MADLITWEEAQRLVLERVRPLDGERLPLDEAAGRIAIEPVSAAVDLPPFDNSAMDGYAVRAADTPGTLAVVGESAAGNPAVREVGRGEAIAISTGAVVPGGSDAVAPVEIVVSRDNKIEVADRIEPGAHIRAAGGDVRAGETVVAAGTRLGPPQVGAIAAAGVAEVVCAGRPRVTVLATGSELRPPGEPLAAGQIYESNGPLLVAQVRGAGAEVTSAPSVADDVDAHRKALERGLDGDVLVTTGGVSVGPHDLVRDVLAELGVEEVFWGVSMKPGKPISFGTRDGTLVFGLPGNPVSALVGCELFVRPALLALQGAADPLPQWERGRLAAPLQPNAHRDELVRARLAVADEGPALEPLSGRESHMIVRAAAADALVLVPRGDVELSAGSLVRFLRLG